MRGGLLPVRFISEAVMSLTTRFAAGLLCFVPLVLPACGGGSGDDDGAAPSPEALFGALHESPDIAFDAAGNGVAVWTESPFDGTASVSRVLYAVYTRSSGTWSLGAELARPATGPRIASTGTGFMAVWTGPIGGLNGVQARAFSGTAWGAAVTLFTSVHAVEGACVASNGTGYAAAWRERQVAKARVHASLYSGTGWDAASALDDDAGVAGVPTIAGKAGGKDFAVAWVQARVSGTEWDVFTALHDAAGGAWDAASVRSTGTGEADSCRLVTNGTGYLLAWAQDDGAAVSVFADLFDGGVWGGAAAVDGTADDCRFPSVASDGAGYAIAWIRSPAEPEGDLDVLRYAGTPLSPVGPVAIETGLAFVSRLPCLASAETGRYAVAWPVGTAAGVDLHASFFDGSAWSVPEVAEAGEGDCRWQGGVPPAFRGNGAGRYELVWSQVDDPITERLQIYARTHTGVWGKVASLSGPGWRAGALSPAVAVAGDGTALAVWTQYRNGRPEVWGRLRTGGRWGDLVAVDRSGSSPAVATDGTGFVVAWSDAVSGVRARAWTAAGWEAAATTVDATPGVPCLASNGTTWALAWETEGGAVAAAIRSGGVWGVATPLVSEASDPRLVAAGSTYVLLCIDESGAVDHPLAFSHDGTWVNEGLIDGGAADSAASPALAARGTECVAAWSQGGRIQARVRSGGAWAGAAAPLDDGAAPASRPVLAASSSGYAAAWEQGGQLVAALASGTTWGAPGVVNVGTGFAYWPRVASNGVDFAIAWLQFDGTAVSLLTRRRDGGVWGSVVLMETGSRDVYPDHVAARDGSGYLSVWTQFLSADPVCTAVGARGF